MKPDQKPDPVLASLAVLFTIAALSIAGCTDVVENHQNPAIPKPETQSGYVTPTISTTRTISDQASPSSPTIVLKDNSDPSQRAIPKGILIDGIPDTRAGDPLVVSGRTSLPAGTDLIIRVVPVTLEKGAITGDFKNLEKSAVTKVVKGSATGNTFTVTLDTGNLLPAEHLVFVSEGNTDASTLHSAPTGMNCSLLFNIISR